MFGSDTKNASLDVGAGESGLRGTDVLRLFALRGVLHVCGLSSSLGPCRIQLRIMLSPDKPSKGSLLIEYLAASPA